MMNKVDMSAAAVTARLKRVSQLRRLCLALQKAKIEPVAETPDPAEHRKRSGSEPDGDKAE
jgi:hypothetical protein